MAREGDDFQAFVPDAGGADDVKQQIDGLVHWLQLYLSMVVLEDETVILRDDQTAQLSLCSLDAEFFEQTFTRLARELFFFVVAPQLIEGSGKCSVVFFLKQFHQLFMYFQPIVQL